MDFAQKVDFQLVQALHANTRQICIEIGLETIVIKVFLRQQQSTNKSTGLYCYEEIMIFLAEVCVRIPTSAELILEM